MHFIQLGVMDTHIVRYNHPRVNINHNIVHTVGTDTITTGAGGGDVGGAIGPATATGAGAATGKGRPTTRAGLAATEPEEPERESGQVRQELQLGQRPQLVPELRLEQQQLLLPELPRDDSFKTSEL
jgi:hypothetical protein